MELDRLIEELSRPAAYTHEAEPVQVHQTHISVVFLAGDRAYKVKKPVDFGFVDYSTLERREEFCRKEVRLNRRLAPEVYLGCIPIVEGPGGLEMGGEGTPIEWAVKMQRLPDERRLEAWLERGELEAEHLRRLGRRIARFHADADRGEEVDRWARFEKVVRHARENFEESADQVGTAVHSEVFDRARELNEDELERRRDRIERRADEGAARDTHGDLRLDHIYLYPEREPPDDLVIVDCIEFNDAFRYADPIADIAFPVMDLSYAGRRDFAEVLVEAYFEESGDESGRELLDFYVAYRAAVRAKVEGLKATEEEVGDEERRRALGEAKAHWMLTLGRLERPPRRPALVVVSGLPATGKSTVARALAEEANFEVVDSDVVRKELAGLDPHTDASEAYGGGIYTEEWSERTYAECRRRAENILYAGGRAVVDATFYRRDRRRPFLELADSYAVPLVVVECQLPRQEVARRIEARSEDVSDADLEIHDRIAQQWETYSERARRSVFELETSGTIEETRRRALDVLRRADLY